MPRSDRLSNAVRFFTRHELGKSDLDPGKVRGYQDRQLPEGRLPAMLTNRAHRDVGSVELEFWLGKVRLLLSTIS